MGMNANKVLAHLGLALVTYVPLPLYLLFVLTRQPEAAAEILTSGIPMFLGFLATTMTMLGWPLVMVSLVIAVRGLVKRDCVGMNAVTLISCFGWFAAAYWVVAHFR